MKNWLTDRNLFWGTLVFLHLCAWGYQINQQNWYLADSVEYWQQGENLWEHGAMYCGEYRKPLREDFYTKRPPVYPIILAGFQLLPHAEIWLSLVQNLLSLFNIWLMLSLMDRVRVRPRRLIWLLPFLILYPAQFIYANLVMTEILFQTVLLLLTIQMLNLFRTSLVNEAMAGRNPEKSGGGGDGKEAVQHFSALIFGSFHLRKRTILGWEKPEKYLLQSGIIIILGMLTKPILYLASLPFLGWAIWLGWRRKKLMQAILIGLIPLLTVFAYNSWNQSRTGYFHFSSIQNLSLLQYSTQNLLIHQLGYEEGVAAADTILYRSLRQASYAEGQQLLQRECFAVIFDQPAAYTGFHLKGMLNFFLDPGRFDIAHFFGWQGEGGLLSAFSNGGYRGVLDYLGQQPLLMVGLLLGVLLMNGIKSLCLLFFAFQKRIPLSHRLIVLAVIGYIAFLTASSGASRFALPVFPLLMVGVAGLFKFGIPFYPTTKRQ
ncbi:MAG: hypothetical protein AAF206_09490 [Bacteroidota bacterium]